MKHLTNARPANELPGNKYDIVQHWCLELLEGQFQGRGILGCFLQLEPDDYRCLTESLSNIHPVLDPEQEQLKAQLLEIQRQRRLEEFNDLYHWLKSYQVSSRWDMARIIAMGSLGFHHLWQDLGLAERPLLTQLMRDCFPELQRINQPPMRWKKFFYRQMCLQHGVLVCRSPSCDECSSRSECFE
ncbi:nitrogen fixation protein NifQ [Celerinatantimonas sp. YJH-8]|uniref:nitrogen fixation protein NifQ n=1 Tax=Celerinatantimonas sp. YJH-8 TaxID=3228714 RepID=UPI0038C379C3